MLTRALGAALVMLGALILASEWLGRPLRFLTEGYAGRQQIAGILLFLAWPVLCIAAGYLLLRSRYPRDAAGIGLGVAPFTVMYVEDNGLAALALLVATVVIILCLMYLSTGALPTRSGSASFRYAGLGIGLFGLLLAALGTPGYYAYQFLGWLATVAILITITITNRGVAQFGMLLGVLFTIGLWVLTIGGDAYWASVEFMIGVLIAVAAVLAYMGRPDYGDMEEAAIAPVHRPTSSAPAPIKMLDASGDPDEASLQGLGHTEPVSGVHEPRHLAMDEGSPESGSSPE